MPVLHSFNGPKGPVTEKLNPARAIRHFCGECYGWCDNWQREVRDCPTQDCPLYPFRFGRDPGHKQDLSDDERERRRERLRLARRRMKNTGKLPQTLEIGTGPEKTDAGIQEGS